MEFPGFCGGIGTHDSPNVNAEDTINWYVDVPAGTPKASPINVRTPGLRPWVELDDSPVRALFHQDRRTFAVAGTTFYEIFDENSWTSRGTVANDADDSPAYISSNGEKAGLQIFIVTGDLGYIFTLNTNVLAQIVDVDFPNPCTMGDYTDGYFAALNPNLSRFNLSALLNGNNWDGTFVGQRNMSSDNLAALIVSNRNIWLFGDQRTEVWYNSGDTFPYRPVLAAGVIETGIVAKHSVKRVDNSIMWLGADERGALNVFRANGFHPEVVSNPTITRILERYTNPHKAMAYTYQEGGHEYYTLYFPDGPDPTTGIPHCHLVYDVSLGPKLGWTRRGLWNSATAQWEPHVSRCHCYDALHHVHLVGDRRTGAVYQQSLDFFDEELVEP